MAFATKPTQTPHRKKRKAGHHKQSKHYHKAYWPYIPVMLFVIGLGVILNSFWTPNKQVMGASDDFTAAKLVENTNEHRHRHDLVALTLDPKLTSAAQAKAEDMARRNYWSHSTPDSQPFSSFIINSGYQYQAIGENLAYGFNNAGQVINGWMNSEEHRENILSKNYQNVGFGVASSPDYLGKGPAVIVVAEYGEPSVSGTTLTFNVNNPIAQVKGDKVIADTQGVSRIQVLTEGKAMWSLAALSAIAGAALMLMIVRHGFRIHRMLSTSEQFIVKHPWLDVGFVFVITLSYVLTRTNGLIQ